MKRFILAILICAVSLTSCGQGVEEQWKEQYDLGVRYLSEGNYEEAIICIYGSGRNRSHTARGLLNDL